MSDDLGPLVTASTEELFEELTKRFPDGIVVFALNPAGPGKEPVHVHARMSHDTNLAPLCGYATIWFAQQGADFFRRVDSEGDDDDEEDDT